MTQKIAVVTGSATRIGKEIALHLARQGWQIAIHYNKSKRKAEKLNTEINAISRSIPIKLDLSTLTGFDSFFQKITSKLGGPTLIVNNAATFSKDNISSTTMRKLEAHMRINCFAPILLAQKFIKINKRTKHAYVINILDSSIDFDNSKSFLSYSLSKACLSQATKLLRVQAPLNVHVNAISPGFVMRSKRQSKREFEASVARSAKSKTWSVVEICKAIDDFCDINATQQ